MEYMHCEGPLPPQSKTIAQRIKYKVDIVLPQKEWIHHFMDFGKAEIEKLN